MPDAATNPPCRLRPPHPPAPNAARYGLRCPSPEVADRIAELYCLPIAISDRLMAAAALTRAYGRSIDMR